MAQVDIHSRMTAVSAFDFQSVITDTTTVGNIIDMQDEQSLELVVIGGSIATGLYTPKIEDGNDPSLSDAADVSADYLLGTIADAAVNTDHEIRKIGYVGKKRYVRVSIVSTGSASGSLAVLAVKSNPGSASIT